MGQRQQERLLPWLLACCINVYQATLEGKVMQLTDGWYDFGSIKTLGNTRNLLVSRHSMLQPDDLYLLTPSKTEKKSKLTQLTFENEHILNQLAMPTLQQRWVKTTDGKEELVWIVLPPHFDANKKYPTLLFCEGGPQSPVSQFWSYRWNFFIMAAHATWLLPLTAEAFLVLEANGTKKSAATGLDSV